MTFPIAIELREMPCSAALELFIRQKFDLLSKDCHQIRYCRVVVERCEGDGFHCYVILDGHHDVIVANRGPELHCAEDARTAVLEAFNATRGLLEKCVDRVHERHHQEIRHLRFEHELQQLA